ncbi:hypothetical protein [Cytobacillus purgationiresistens]|nr:hypothetical protein [Cytobacillus purgationiresistens]
MTIHDEDRLFRCMWFHNTKEESGVGSLLSGIAVMKGFSRLLYNYHVKEK